MDLAQVSLWYVVPLGIVSGDLVLIKAVLGTGLCDCIPPDWEVCLAYHRHVWGGT